MPIPKTCYGNEVAEWKGNDLHGWSGAIIGSIYRVFDYEAWFWHDVDNKVKISKAGFESEKDARSWMIENLREGKMCEKMAGKVFKFPCSDSVFEVQIYDCIDDKIAENDTYIDDYYNMTDWINTNDMVCYIWQTLVDTSSHWDINRQSTPNEIDDDNEEDVEKFDNFADCVNDYLKLIRDFRRNDASRIVKEIIKEWEEIVKDKPWKDQVEIGEGKEDVDFEIDLDESDCGMGELEDNVKMAISEVEDGREFIRVRTERKSATGFIVTAYVLCD